MSHCQWVHRSSKEVRWLSPAAVMPTHLWHKVDTACIKTDTSSAQDRITPSLTSSRATVDCTTVRPGITSAGGAPAWLTLLRFTSMSSVSTLTCHTQKSHFKCLSVTESALLWIEARSLDTHRLLCSKAALKRCQKFTLDSRRVSVKWQLKAWNWQLPYVTTSSQFYYCSSLAVWLSVCLSDVSKSERCKDRGSADKMFLQRLKLYCVGFSSKIMHN